MSVRPEALSSNPKPRVASMKGHLVRPLGAHERLLYLYSCHHPRHFCVVAEIAGRLRTNDFRLALDKVQDRHPLLGVEIREDGLTGAGFHAIESRLPLTFQPLVDDYDWHGEVEHQLTDDFPALPGPLMRTTVLHAETRAIVVLAFHHAIADGLSASYILRDMMVALAGHALEALPSLPSMETLFSAQQGAASAPSPTSIVTVDPDTLRAIAARPTWRPFVGDRLSVSSFALDECSSGHLRERAKLEKTTLHGALGAALVLSAFDESPAESYTVLHPISLRNQLGLNQGDCGLYVATVCTRFARGDDTAFWELARQVTGALALPRSAADLSRAMQHLATKLPATASPHVANGLFGALRYDSVLSNLGELPIPGTVGDLRLTALWGPMVQDRFINERMFGAVTINGCLRLTQTSPAHLTSLLQPIHGRLTAAAKA